MTIIMSLKITLYRLEIKRRWTRERIIGDITKSGNKALIMLGKYRQLLIIIFMIYLYAKCK